MPGLIADLPERFADAYLERYGHINPGERAECITVRLSAIGHTNTVRTLPLTDQEPAETMFLALTRFGRAMAPHGCLLAR